MMSQEFCGQLSSPDICGLTMSSNQAGVCGLECTKLQGAACGKPSWFLMIFFFMIFFFMMSWRSWRKLSRNMIWTLGTWFCPNSCPEDCVYVPVYHAPHMSYKSLWLCCTIEHNRTWILQACLEFQDFEFILEVSTVLSSDPHFGNHLQPPTLSQSPHQHLIQRRIQVGLPTFTSFTRPMMSEILRKSNFSSFLTTRWQSKSNVCENMWKCTWNTRNNLGWRQTWESRPIPSEIHHQPGASSASAGASLACPGICIRGNPWNSTRNSVGSKFGFRISYDSATLMLEVHFHWVQYNHDNHVRLERLEVLNLFSMTCGPPLWASENISRAD